MDGNDPLDPEGGEQARAVEDQGLIDWQKIKRDFIHGDWSIARIAEARGSSETTISKRAKHEGWVRLVGTKRLPSGRKPRAPGAPVAKRASAEQCRRRRMVRRLFEVIDAKMNQIEERMAQVNATGEAGQSSAEAERDMRSLSAFARLYAKLVELDETARKGEAKQGSDTDAATRSEDADQLRRDLTLRLQRLDRAGDA